MVMKLGDLRPGNYPSQNGGMADLLAYLQALQTASASAPSYQVAGDVVPFTRPYNMPVITNTAPGQLLQFPYWFTNDKMSDYFNPSANTNKPKGGGK